MYVITYVYIRINIYIYIYIKKIYIYMYTLYKYIRDYRRRRAVFMLFRLPYYR